MIFLFGDVHAPVPVVEVPLYGFPKAGIESFLWLPTEFAGDFSTVDGVAAVVARPILHEDFLISVGVPVSAWLEFIEYGAEGVYDLQVWFFT